MVLVDTSVWVHHFRNGNRYLQALLNEGRVACHPFVVGESALGSLKNRAEILSLLRALPQAPRLEDDEVLTFIEKHRLMSRGIGLVDAHLSASARLLGARLWTTDKKLAEVASDLGLLFRVTSD